jgi:hypothetical protein
LASLDPLRSHFGLRRPNQSSLRYDFIMPPFLEGVRSTGLLLAQS